MLKTKVTRVECVNGAWSRLDNGSPVSGGVVYQEVNQDGKPVIDVDEQSRGFGKPVYWVGVATREASDPPDPVAPKAIADYTDVEIAADPLFPLIQRVAKALRTFGPTTKRPTGLDTTDKGFMYVDNTLCMTIWWYGTLWRDATGTAR